MKPELPASLWPLVHRAAAGEGWPPSSGAAADLLVGDDAQRALESAWLDDVDNGFTLWRRTARNRGLGEIELPRADEAFILGRQTRRIPEHREQDDEYARGCSHGARACNPCDGDACQECSHEVPGQEEHMGVADVVGEREGRIDRERRNDEHSPST